MSVCENHMTLCINTNGNYTKCINIEIKKHMLKMVKMLSKKESHEQSNKNPGSNLPVQRNYSQDVNMHFEVSISMIYSRKMSIRSCTKILLLGFLNDVMLLLIL